MDNEKTNAEPSGASGGSLAWIPVTERLPPVGVEVCVVGESDYDIGYIAVEDHAIGWFWECRLYASDFVTHWMALPAPPTTSK
jgi:hypothetical protein